MIYYLSSKTEKVSPKIIFEPTFILEKIFHEKARIHLSLLTKKLYLHF